MKTLKLSTTLIDVNEYHGFVKVSSMSEIEKGLLKINSFSEPTIVVKFLNSGKYGYYIKSVQIYNKGIALDVNNNRVYLADLFEEIDIYFDYMNNMKFG